MSDLADTWVIFMLALLVWREARNQPLEAQLAVACTVRNRVRRPGWWGSSYIGVILAPWQYSSFNHADRNAEAFPLAADPVFMRCLTVARDVYEGTAADNTDGAESYYDRSLDSDPPSWAKEMTHTVNVGDFRFFRMVASQVGAA